MAAALQGRAPQVQGSLLHTSPWTQPIPLAAGGGAGSPCELQLSPLPSGPPAARGLLHAVFTLGRRGGGLLLRSFHTGDNSEWLKLTDQSGAPKRPFKDKSNAPGVRLSLRSALPGKGPLLLLC